MALTMVFNLDSEVQMRQWCLLRGEVPGLWSGTRGALEAVRSGDPSAQRWFAGVLRTAMLFSPQVVLTDAQLLDGVFFTAFTAPGTLELLGMPLADRPVILVRTRAASLEESLRRFATSPDCRHMRVVIWSSVLASLPAETDPGELFTRLEGVSVDGVADAPRGMVAAAVASALEHGLGLGAGGLRGLAQAWQSWFDAEAAGLIETVPMELPDQKLFESRMRRYLTAELAGQPDELLLPLQAQPDRSHARIAIDALDLGDLERQRLHATYADAYSLALSESCGAEVWLKVRQGADEGVAPQAGLRAGQLALSGAATAQLGEMTPARFQSFRYEARDAIADWQQKAGRDTTRELAYQVRVASARGNVRSQRRSVLTRALMVTALALIAFLLDLIPELDGRWTVLSLGAALLVGVLPEAVASWREYRTLSDRNLSSVIELTGE